MSSGLFIVVVQQRKMYIRKQLRVDRNTKFAYPSFQYMSIEEAMYPQGN